MSSNQNFFCKNNVNSYVIGFVINFFIIKMNKYEKNIIMILKIEILKN